MTTEVPEHLKDLRNLLAELIEIPGAPGFEEPMMAAFKERIEPYADSVEIDPKGNVIGKIEGTEPGAPSLMIAAHLDEVGFIVTSIEARGFLRIRRLGGPAHRSLPARMVRIMGEDGSIFGVIGIKPGHITSGEEALRIPPMEELYIDVGASSPEEVQEMGVEVGAPAIFYGGLVPLGNPYRIASKSVDDRAGIVALLKVGERLKENRPKGTVYLVGSVEEEIELRGAATAAYHLNPSMAVAIDTQPTNGTPDLKPGDLPFEIGKGPIIKVSEEGGLVTHPKVRKLLIDAAHEAGVSYQLGAATPGRSDASSIEQGRSGIPTAMLGIPRRYSHSPTEVLDLRDLQGLVEVMATAIGMVDEHFSLSRI